MVDVDKLKKLLLHREPNVRMDAGRAMQKFFPGAGNVIHVILDSIDRHGLPANLPLASLLRFFLPNSEEIGELTRLYTEALRYSDTYHERLQLQLEKTFLLFPFSAIQEASTSFRFNRELRRIYDKARGLDTLKRRKPEFLWKRLVEFCENHKGTGLYGDELIYGKILISGLSRHREEVSHRILMNLKREAPWNYHLEEYLIELAGEMKLEKAVFYLFQRLSRSGTGETLHTRTIKSLSLIGTPQVISEAGILYKKGIEPIQSYPEILSGINHPDSENLLLELFRDEEEPGNLSVLATALCGLFSLEGAEQIERKFTEKKMIAVLNELQRSLRSVYQYHRLEIKC